MGQSGIVDTHIHAVMQDPDGGEHREDLLLVGQVTLVREEGASVARTLALGRQPLKQPNRLELNQELNRENSRGSEWG